MEGDGVEGNFCLMFFSLGVESLFLKKSHKTFFSRISPESSFYLFSNS